MSMTDILRNETEYKFTDISSEKWRQYRFPSDDVEGNLVFIADPIALHVSRSGGHRVLDAHGVSHYVPKGWIELSWEAREDQPHFVA